MWIDEELDKQQTGKELNVRGKTQRRIKNCLRPLKIGRAHVHFYMAGNKGGKSLNIRALKFWGLTYSPTACKMELVKFMKRIM